MKHNANLIITTTLPDWPSVTVDRFVKALEQHDYERGWFQNAVEFVDRRTGRIIGYEIGDAVQRGYLLHPDLAVQE